MHTRNFKKTSVVAISLASATLLVLTSCARGGDAESSPGITDDTITFGISTPLSGTTAGPGNCTVDGLTAYMEAANAEGGIEFGDGQTRTVEIQALDDTYDPQKASANYQQLSSEVFAMTTGLGTPTNLAWREAANADEVPQVFIESGDPIFSDQQESPWSLGFIPVYQNEGEAFGQMLADSGDHTVAILSQNDDFGEGYVEGFKSAIEGADNIEVVKELTYEATDDSVDAQITELAGTGADVIFNAMSITPLVISAMERAQSVDWNPSWFQPSNTSSPDAILGPASAETFPGVYTVAFSKAPAAPQFADDDDVQTFLEHLDTYTDQDGPPAFPHCMWSYMTGAALEQVFEQMEEPTRENFMEHVRDIEDFQAPLMLDGTAVNTTEDGQPAVSDVVIQKYNGQGFDTVDTIE